jgi:hypothetical protein
VSVGEIAPGHFMLLGHETDLEIPSPVKIVVNFIADPGVVGVFCMVTVFMLEFSKQLNKLPLFKLIVRLLEIILMVLTASVYL